MIFKTSKWQTGLPKEDEYVLATIELKLCDGQRRVETNDDGSPTTFRYHEGKWQYYGRGKWNSFNTENFPVVAWMPSEELAPYEADRKPESHIESSLVISTENITEETANMLDEADQQPCLSMLCVYRKEEYGWWININPQLKPEEVKKNLPKDLADAILLAKRYGADWLMIDCDAEPDPDLLQYAW